jgi:hypothetical protein
LSGVGHFPVWILFLNGDDCCSATITLAPGFYGDDCCSATITLAPGFYIALIVAQQQSTNPVLNGDLWSTEWTYAMDTTGHIRPPFKEHHHKHEDDHNEYGSKEAEGN